MREITSHRITASDLSVGVFALDEPSFGGASHRYLVLIDDRGRCVAEATPIMFQRGPVATAGVNGLTVEALLAIVMDRLAGFQAGQFACEENQQALDHVAGALNCLHQRTKSRMARGVEGKMEP